MPILKEIFRLAVYVIIILVGFSIYTCYIYLKPRRHVSAIRPDQMGLAPYDEIEFRTEDGINIKGWYIPAKERSEKAIIICHGYPMDKGNVLDLAPPFHNDYNVLLFDFRGLGESGGTFTTLGLNETKDFDAAVDYLRNKGMKKIGALGFSLGGVVIIMANNPYVTAAVSDSAFAELGEMIDVVYDNFGIFRHPFAFFTKLVAKYIFGMDPAKVSPLEAIRDFKAPLFLIHSKVDNLVSMESLERLYQARPDCERWVIPTALHGQTHLEAPEEYDEKVLAFFQKHL